MKTIVPVITAVISLGVGFGTGYVVGRGQSSDNPSLTPNNILSTGSKSSGGSDKYEIQWQGKKGTKLVGSYAILRKVGDPIQVEQVEATLPHKITFSAPKGAIVSAGGGTLNQGSVTVKIYKNGSECGKQTVVGSGIPANKTCQ